MVTTKTLRRRFFSIAGRLTRSARRLTLCICHSAGPGKTSSVAPWHGCEQFHSQPDGTAGINADGGLTRPPDYPTASQTCARLVPERLLLRATLTISPSIATAGRHHRSCVAISRRPHPLYWNQARSVRLPLPIIPCVNATAHRFGGFGLIQSLENVSLATLWAVKPEGIQVYLATLQSARFSDSGSSFRMARSCCSVAIGRLCYPANPRNRHACSKKNFGII